MDRCDGADAGGGRRRRWERTLLVLGVLASFGCYSNVPVERGVVPPGTEVKVDLTSAGAERLQGLTGRRGGAVSGALLQDGADTVRVMAAVQGVQSQFQTPGATVEVAFPSGEVEGIQVREFSRVRTGLLALGSAVVVGLVINSVSGGGSEGTETPPPLLQFRLPIPFGR